MLEKIFKLNQRNTNIKTELLAGLTIFVSVSYVLALTPQILAKTGMDTGALFTATGLAAIIATLFMAFLANQPIAVAPSPTINTFIILVIVLRMGHSWQFALTAVAIESLLFTLMICFNLREAMINTIPKNLLLGITSGLGFFVILFGLSSLGLIRTADKISSISSYTIQPLMYGNISLTPIIVIVAGVCIGSVLIIKKIKGAILISILCSTMIGIPLGITTIPNNFTFFRLPPSISPIFCNFQFENIYSSDLLLAVLSLLFLDLFNVIGTLVGITSKAGLLKRENHLDRMHHALLSCSLGSLIGAFLGTSTSSPYIESTAGVIEGGKTGLTSLTTAILFGLALFFYPIITLIPPPAIVVALVLSGLYLMKSLKYIDFDDPTEYIPSILTIIIIPLLCSIAGGIIIGTVTYVLMKLITGKIKQLDIVLVILAILYCISIAFFKINMFI